MKTAGIVLIVAGILMLLFRGINFTKEKKVVDIGPVEINKKEKKTLHWPDYAGGVIMVAGVIVLLTARKKEA